MTKRSSIPDLSFPRVSFGQNETPWNLHILLYKGGAATNSRKVEEMIAKGQLGAPQLNRLDLVERLHDQMTGDLAAGGSRSTAWNRVTHLRHMFEFADDHDLSLTISNITDTFCTWADSLLRRTRLTEHSRRGKQGAISMAAAYGSAAMVGVLLNRILERNSNIVELTGLRALPQGKSKSRGNAEKQNFDDTFAFGHFLLDICDTLNIETIGTAIHPFSISLRTGQRIPVTPADVKNNRGRNKLIDLRIEAELEFFIAQTGMNSAQAITLKLCQFSYRSHGDDYQVVDYKQRRDGTVLFVIFKEYRPHFERYLIWRREFCHESEKRLFPFIGNDGTRQERRYRSGNRTATLCKLANILHVAPRMLRGARLNWFLRRTGDSDVTSGALQTGVGKVNDVYRWENQQQASGEIVRFWKRADPALIESVAPGGCTGRPKETNTIPEDAPRPDCGKASGCLWCDDHRDVESFEYVWAMTSFKRLKLLELSRVRPPVQRQGTTAPAALSIERIDTILGWYREYSPESRAWVAEAAARLEEGDYHPDWQSEILTMEGAK